VKRVAIIGGGLAGLTCGHSLRRRSIDVTIFESNKRAGGRDLAAFYLLAPDLFEETFQLINDVGLSSQVISISPHAGQLYKGRIYHHRVASAAGLLSFKGLSFMDKALLPRMAYLLSRHSSELHFHHPERGLRFDNESVAAYVKRELSQNVLNYVGGPLISTLFYYGSEQTSAWLYLILAKHMSHVQMSTIRGGLGRIAGTLAKDLRVVHLAIERVSVDGPAYVIEGERFSDVVIAVPGDAVLRIGGIQDLMSEQDRQFFRNVRYQRVVSVRVATEKPVDGRCYAVSIPRVERFAASTISFHDYIDPSSVTNSQGLLTISGGGDTVSAQQLMQELQRLYPIQNPKTEIFEWNSATPTFPPGRYGEITQFQNRPRRPGLFFCGDYLLGPLIEGAIAAGKRAADSIQT
jgi:protoporphyrinogen oxidase